MFLVKLFEIEVPEIQDGTIEIKAAAREPGHRAKIAVYTNDRDIDPVGACVGMKGSRVQNIVNELAGEKIDIVKWHPEIDVFVRNALAPADISSISLNHDDRLIDVIVEEDQLSLAIGRRGQNVRLAAMLSGWKVNIISKTKLQEQVKQSVENLIQVEGLNDAQAHLLVQSGVMSIVDLSASEPSMIQKLINCEEEEAKVFIAKASSAIENEDISNEPEEDEIISASAVPSQRMGMIKDSSSSNEDDEDKFSDAEKRLREELAAFKLK
jgi:N utilization substance protein A